MIREALHKVLTEFAAAREQPLKGHPLAAWMRHEAPEEFRESVPEASGFTMKASSGSGVWVKGPWVGFFDPIITGTAQEGYYVVYLFAYDLGSVALSLNQVVTALRKELGARVAKQVLTSRAAILTARMDDERPEGLTTEPIDLHAPKDADLLELYEYGHAFGTTYEAAKLPTEETLATDLTEMLRLYRLATLRGGTEEIVIDPDDKSKASKGEKIDESRRVLMHERIERRGKLPRLAKQIHGFRCQVCDFDFSERYGELGDGYIEAHHKVPLSQIPGDAPVSLSPRDDFAVVCANCHRMLHRKGAPETFEEFVEQFGATR